MAEKLESNEPTVRPAAAEPLGAAEDALLGAADAGAGVGLAGAGVGGTAVAAEEQPARMAATATSDVAILVVCKSDSSCMRVSRPNSRLRHGRGGHAPEYSADLIAP
jgi:hypothetical protein